MRRHTGTPATAHTRTMHLEEMVGNAYLLPPNYQDLPRLDFQHLMLERITRTNYFAPITDVITPASASPPQILDVGCGTGRWCTEMARAFPFARVHGVDLHPPHLSDAPANCTFAIGNILSGLSDIPAQSQAYTHARLLIAGIPYGEWPHVIAEYARVTKPGGWIEIVEGSFPAGTPAIDAVSWWSHQMAMQRGIDMRVGPQIVELFRSPVAVAGEANRVPFVDLHQVQIPIPCGAYGGRAGALMQADVIAAVAAIRSRVLQSGVCTAAEYDAQASRLVEEFGRAQTGQVTFWVTYARRG